MAKIKIKNSVTPGLAPSGLSFGEMAVNIVDKKIFIGNAVEGVVTLHDQNNIVTSVNGSTGAITNVARTNIANTFTQLQDFSAGISASTSTNVIDVLATTDGCGLRIAQAASGSSARVGGIQLGRGSSNTANSYIENYVGQLKFFNGISGTNETPGTNMLQLSTTSAIFGVPIAGATFSSTIGQVTIQKSAYSGSDSGYLRIVGADVLNNNQYNSDIRANASAVADTTHTLPAVTGTLLNTASNYVSGICGATGAITLTAGSNMTITKSGNIFTFASSGGGGGGGGLNFTYSSSAPGTPADGDRWMDSDTGKEYIYVNDGTSSQWIEPISSNGLVGVTYTSASNFLEFGLTGSFVKLGVNNTSPQYTLDVNGVINTPVGISAGGSTFSGPVTSDGGYIITSSAINTQTGTTYSLLSTDNGKIITMNNGSAITLTVPSGLPVGFNTTVIQLGTGQVEITGSSTTLNSFESKFKLAGQHAAASIISYTTNVFNVAGGLTA
jgi:hypothetical protein